jgi:hypothetical protein
MAGKRKHYAVARGRSGPAIYDNWESCSAQVTGVPGARYKSFKTRQEAEDFLVKEGGGGTTGSARGGISPAGVYGASDTESFGAAVAAAAGGVASASRGGNNFGDVIDLCCSQDDSSRQSYVHEAGASTTGTAGIKRAKYEGDWKPAAILSQPVDLCESSDEEGVAGDAHASSVPGASESSESSAPEYSSFAHKMMSKMGHKGGKGLGKAGQGIPAPLTAVGRPATKGGGPGVGFGSLLKTPNALQSKAIEAAKRGDNVFITGPAGTYHGICSIFIHVLIAPMTLEMTRSGVIFVRCLRCLC